MRSSLQTGRSLSTNGSPFGHASARNTRFMASPGAMPFAATKLAACVSVLSHGERRSRSSGRRCRTCVWWTGGGRRRQ